MTGLNLLARRNPDVKMFDKTDKIGGITVSATTDLCGHSDPWKLDEVKLVREGKKEANSTGGRTLRF